MQLTMVVYEDAVTFLKKSWRQLNDLPVLAQSALWACLSGGSPWHIVGNSDVLNCKSKQTEGLRFSYSYI